MITLINKQFFLFLFLLLLGCSDSPVEPYFPPIPDENGDNDTIIDPNENIYNNYDWVQKVSLNHPRLFLSERTLPDVKRLTLNDEQELYAVIKSRVDGLLGQDIVISVESDHQLANRSAEAAFVYLITGDQRYFDLSKNLLRKVIEYYNIRNNNRLIINWYYHSRAHALMAYDWIYDDLAAEDRESIGTALFEELEYMLPSANRSTFPGENRSSEIWSGFYSNEVLEWYMGVVFYKTNINERINKRAEELLKKGYDDHNEVLKHRQTVSGDDGGAATGTLAYSFLDFPYAEYNFLQTFNSATGYDISTQFNYLPNFANYVYWNLLPNNREFGFGSASHEDNTITFPVISLFLSQLIHFYGDRFPEHASLAKWLIESKYPRRLVDTSSYTLARFFLTNQSETIGPNDPTNRMPQARYFEGMGQFFMRSGSGDNDTYATFTVGTNTHHKHYDNNNFNIYKKGFLTLDTGSRPDGIHTSHYYPRTVAHNCITIRMPGETFPPQWENKRAPHEPPGIPYPNDGGQVNNGLDATDVIAFDETEHYIYIASDAAKSYSAAKTNQVLRQFVFLPPNNFIIFDRVNATNPTYPKKWLLHTAYKPEQVNDKEFYASHEEGRLVCRTIYPEDPRTELIGGPGKQFWSDGQNWPMPYGGDNHPLYGQWRIEISPRAENNNDVFLHVIQVGDRADDIRSISSAVKVEESGMKGVKFSYEGKDYQVLFTTSGPASGKISITSNGTTIINETFASNVKGQTGLSLK